MKSPEDIDYSTAEEIKKGTMHEFESREVWEGLSNVFLFLFVRW